MAQTRLVFEYVRRGDGVPVVGCEVRIDVARTTTTMHATFPGTIPTAPQSLAGVPPILTDDTGRWESELEIGVPLVLTYPGANIVRGSSVLYPPGKPITFVVPDGDGPISIPTILAASITPPDDPTLIDFVANHLSDNTNPHSVTKEQVELGNVPNVDATQRANHTGTQAIETVDGLQDALDAKVPTSRTVNGHALNSDVTVSKGDVGLGNVADTAPADLPVSTATQTALNNAVDTLETSIATKANTTDVATAVDGLNATIGAVSDGLTAHEDNHENPHNVTKAQVELGNVDNTADADKPVSTDQQTALDGKAPLAAAVKTGGRYGQILIKRSATDYDAAWADPPGIVYPSLLLSPDGSMDRNGVVTPTVVGDVSVVDGQYGDAWRTSSGNRVEIPIAYINVAQYTILTRMRYQDDQSKTDYAIICNGTNGILLGNHPSSPGRWIVFNGGVNARVLELPLGATFVGGSRYQYGQLSPWVNGAIGNTVAAPTATLLGSIIIGKTGVDYGDIESVVIFPVGIPDAEIARISTMPTAWTMDNCAVNMALANQPAATTTSSTMLSYFPPNKTIASGGAGILRTAPGTTAPTITTLATSTAVHDTGQRITASSVSYALIMTTVGQGWVPATALI